MYPRTDFTSDFCIPDTLFPSVICIPLVKTVSHVTVEYYTQLSELEGKRTALCIAYMHTLCTVSLAIYQLHIHVHEPWVISLVASRL